MTHADDAELVARACRGEPAAFETIMRRHNRLLFRAARGVVADDAEAQDVVQETYLRAFSRLHQFRADAALGTWLARIAINVAIGTLRRQGRLVPLDGPDGLTDDFIQEHDMSASPAHRELPEAAAERAQLRGILQSAIEALPPIYRSVFILRAVEEVSVEDAAFCLQVSPAVVKTRFLRARSMLRRALGERFESQASHAFAFAGARCEAVVNRVMAELSRQQHPRLH